MKISIEYKDGSNKTIKSIRIEGKRTCAFGGFKQALDITADKKDIRILDINNVTSMWMNKNDLSKYINLLQQVHNQMES